MSNEPNKPIAAQELTEKELEGVTGGGEELILPPPYVPLTWEPKCEPFKPLLPLVVDPALGAH